VELSHRAVEVRNVVQNRMPEHEVEALVGKWQLLGLRSHCVQSQSESAGRRGEGVEHALGDVGCRGALDQPELEQVEAEVAGTGADLQRVAEGLARLAAQGLDQLGANLILAHGPEVDAPFGVVVGGGDVVVARVGVLDLSGSGGRGGGHGGEL
jgi:hypothetical protein